MGGMKSIKTVVASALSAGAILASVLSGCEDRTRDEQCYNFHEVSGAVRDSISGIPLDSALVSLHDTNGVTSATDSLGSYKVGAAGCSMLVFARKAGYLMKVRNLQDPQGNVENLDFDLVRE